MENLWRLSGETVDLGKMPPSPRKLSLFSSLWHFGIMGDAKKPQLRYSFPPFYVGTIDAGLPIMSIPGDTYQVLERSHAITADEARTILLTIRERLRWSRAMMSAFLGVSQLVLRRWETGERKPSGAARRLIWLIGMLIMDRRKLESGIDLIVWGKPGAAHQKPKPVKTAPLIMVVSPQPHRS